MVEKAAVLFIGRTNFYNNTYSLFFKNFINNNENILFDIYIATWELPESEKKDLIDKYNPKQILEYRVSDYKRFIKQNDLAPVLARMKRKKYNNNCNIHDFKPSGIDVFLIQCFFLNKGLHKINKKTKYDFIFKNRFDVSIEEPFVITSIPPGRVFCPRLVCYNSNRNSKKDYIIPKKGFKCWKIHDPFFFGTADTMLTLLNLLHDLENRMLIGIRPETLFVFNFLYNEVKVKSNLDLKIQIIREDIPSDSPCDHPKSIDGQEQEQEQKDMD